MVIDLIELEFINHRLICIKNWSLVTIRETGIRIFRQNKKYAVFRGTFIKLANNNYLLYHRMNSFPSKARTAETKVIAVKFSSE